MILFSDGFEPVDSSIELFYWNETSASASSTPTLAKTARMGHP